MDDAQTLHEERMKDMDKRIAEYKKQA